MTLSHTTPFRRICLIVLDSVGIGEAPDANKFGDEGAHTLRHILEHNPHLQLPNLQKLGLGNIEGLPQVSAATQPKAYFGKMQEASVGKDTMTGHWELMGLKVETPFNTYENGFPSALIAQFEQATGRKVLGNKPASGTEIIEEYGEEQMRTGSWIVYTSADSVFQIAAHEEVIPLEELYRACEIARTLTLQPEFSVGRVIARPYTGQPGQFKRTPNRHDYAVKPPEPTVMNALARQELDVIAVGKISDIFTNEGVTQSYPTKSNQHGVEETISQLTKDFHGLLFTNLVDFDSLYGHRRDPAGYGQALKEFDDALPDLLNQLKNDDLLILTADHGNDPVHAGTDHTRELVPLLAYSPGLMQTGDLGLRSTFSDVGATIADNFKAKMPEHGQSFLEQLK
ncbi:phosphopentomutase [Paenibacillus algicola]|uniref:Phosphopentomutase n=1 Tax=Paenibacillus algicola TaxID=2565926 RepID=A0A4P8XQ13_9BACL|nr:phosphopentomutase [Paenibacillus algicola]QCT02499.1 phosphopentomutase [Paenibacillus algicola]